jgi:hypothetical protein
VREYSTYSSVCANKRAGGGALKCSLPPYFSMTVPRALSFNSSFFLSNSCFKSSTFVGSANK